MPASKSGSTNYRVGDAQDYQLRPALYTLHGYNLHFLLKDNNIVFQFMHRKLSFFFQIRLRALFVRTVLRLIGTSLLGDI